VQYAAGQNTLLVLPPTHPKGGCIREALDAADSDHMSSSQTDHRLSRSVCGPAAMRAG
jgi:hypothetical protein